MRQIGLVILFFLPLTLGAEEEGWESVYHRGELVEEILSNEEGQPLRLKSYRNEVLLEEAFYSYTPDKIIINTERVNFEGSGSQWTDTLFLRHDGSLRKMIRTGIYDPFLLGWSIHNYWHISESRSEITTFNERGGELGRVVLSDRVPVEEEFFLYDEEGNLESSQWHRYPLDEVEISEYNQNELIREVRLYREDLLVSQTQNTYNADNRLIKKIILGEGHTESWTGRYDDAGQLTEEKFFQNGMLNRKISYEGDERNEEIYSRGNLTLRIKYKGDELISEEKFD